MSKTFSTVAIGVFSASSTTSVQISCPRLVKAITFHPPTVYLVQDQKDITFPDNTLWPFAWKTELADNMVVATSSNLVPTSKPVHIKFDTPRAIDSYYNFTLSSVVGNTPSTITAGRFAMLLVMDCE